MTVPDFGEHRSGEGMVMILCIPIGGVELSVVALQLSRKHVMWRSPVLHTLWQER